MTAMRGVILAAGKGSRLNGTTADTPKCLLEIAGRSLIERQIRHLRAAGIDEIAVVVGCQADRVRRACGPGICFVENTRFAQTNSLYSLWLARTFLSTGFVVLNCDVLFHRQLLTDLLTARHEDALLVAPAGPDTSYSDEEMKVMVRRGCVVRISKGLAGQETDGENVGIGKFGAAGATVLAACMDELIAEGRLRDWAPMAFQAFAERRPLYAVPTRGFAWIEIDFPEDYRRAQTEVLAHLDDEAGANDQRPPSGGISLARPPESTPPDAGRDEPCSPLRRSA
jgi:choline kinase